MAAYQTFGLGQQRVLPGCPLEFVLALGASFCKSIQALLDPLEMELPCNVSEQIVV